MNKQIRDFIKNHAEKTFPNECCGVVSVNFLGDVKCFESENLSLNKESRFLIDNKVLIDAYKFGHVVCFYHSHASTFKDDKLNKFSKEDIDCSEESCIPAYLYVVNHNTWHYHRPKGYKHQNLMSRPFIWGIWDCYRSVVDYLREKNIIIGNYFPEDEIDLKKEIGFEKGLEKEPSLIEIGVSEMKPNDILFFKINSNYINHCAVYIGDNKYFHHQLGKYACEREFEEKMFNKLYKVYRYNDKSKT